MFDIIIESLRALLILALFIFLLSSGKKLYKLRDKGWKMIVIGFTLLLFSSLIDITDNFPALNRFIIIGDTELQSLIEKALTGLGGFIFVVLGFISWIPCIQSQQQQNIDLAHIIELRTKDLEQTNEELIKSLKNAEELRRSKSQFLAAIVHDIRTPLNTIISLTEILENNSQKEETGIIKSSCDLLMHFLNELLDLSKLEEGKMSLNLTTMPVKALLEETDHLFSQQAKHKGLLLCLESQSPELLIKVDKERLLQLICNLISNALKFTDQGHIAINISNTPVVDSSTKLTITVSDTGPGIPEKQIPLIFDAYKQLESKERKFGSGLGLFICSEIVKLMHGSLSCDSEVGAGTSFTVQIPVETTDELIENEAEKTTPKNNVSNLTALIADDLEINRLILEKFLSKYFVQINHASNGKEALQMASSSPPSVIFLDYEMPDINGLDVARHLKSSQKTCRIPTVMITSDETISHIEDFYELFDHQVLKPVTKEKIRRLISLLLNNNRE